MTTMKCSDVVELTEYGTLRCPYWRLVRVLGEPKRFDLMDDFESGDRKVRAQWGPVCGVEVYDYKADPTPVEQVTLWGTRGEMAVLRELVELLRAVTDDERVRTMEFPVPDDIFRVTGWVEIPEVDDFAELDAPREIVEYLPHREWDEFDGDYGVHAAAWREWIVVRIGGPTGCRVEFHDPVNCEVVMELDVSLICVE